MESIAAEKTCLETEELISKFKNILAHQDMFEYRLLSDAEKGLFDKFKRDVAQGYRSLEA